MATVRDRGWDEEVDVVVLGCGGAGAVAAVTACDAGARVMLLKRVKEAATPGCPQWHLSAM